MDSFVAKANVGAGTDQIAGKSTASGFVGSVLLTDKNGAEIDIANPVPVAIQGSIPVTIASAIEITNDAGNAIPVQGTFWQATQPVSAAALPLPAGASTEASLAALSAKLTATTGIPDNLSSGINVRPIGQDTWACSFSDVGAILSSDFTLMQSGTGVGYSQAGGSLLVTTGTGTNQEFLARSTRSWRGTLALRYSFVASQRIANQNFAVILADLIGEGLACTINGATSISVTKAAHGFTAANVGQFMFVGGISGAAGVPGRFAIASIPNADTINFTVAGWPASGSCTLDLFGHSYIKQQYTGTTATNVAADVQRRGWAVGDSTLTINTTAAPGHIMQAHCAGREVYWSDALRASSTAPNVTVRGSRFENLPDDNVDLYLFFWSYNGTVAPATTTTWTISFAAVEKFANLPVYIQGQELQGAAAPAPVTVVGTAAVSVTAGTINPVVPATPYFLNSAATTNLALIIAGTSNVSSFYATNDGASTAFVKLYNKATAPVLATDVPEMVIPVPAAVGGIPGVANPNIGFHGFRFALGLGIAVTGGSANADATAVASGQVKVKLSRTV